VAPSEHGFNLPSFIMRRITALVISALLAAPLARADVILPALFADHMVLQQGRPLPMWGWADPGESVTVEFKGARVSTKADEGGRWKIQLPAQSLNAGGAELVFKGKNTVTLKDVLVGEVWLCSGQSNMEFTLSKAMNATDEIAAATSPQIRQFLVKKTIAEMPAESVDGEWQVCSSETAGKFTAVGYFFAREINNALHVPVGLIHSSWGGTPIESWLSEEKLKSDPAYGTVFERRARNVAAFPEAHKKYLAEQAEWDAGAAEAKAAGQPYMKPKPRAPVGPGHPYMPVTLYNGMIHPLVPYAMRGVLWYQGESNAGRSVEYQKLFPALISQWRAEWGEGDFPFYFVQLANFNAGGDGTGTNWAFLRDAQTKTLTEPSTGMAVTIDIGNPKDVHPTNKQEVGRRLALVALAKTYADAGQVKEFSGPVYRQARREGGAWRVWFDHADGLTAKGDVLTGFQIAGQDGRFVTAGVRIDADGTVVVSSPGVPEPEYVRYAWTDSPEAGLFNAAGLPAVPFRTDALPGR
jgi:sialate O-acetylesterase